MTGELNRFNFCSVFSPFCKHIYSSVLDNCIMLSATLSVPLSILDRVSFIGYSHFCPIQFIRAFKHLLPPLHICVTAKLVCHQNSPLNCQILSSKIFSSLDNEMEFFQFLFLPRTMVPILCSIQKFTM